MFPLESKGGPQDFLGPLAPHDWSEVLVGGFLFLILFVVIRFFVYPKFEETYTERAAEIEGGIERAEKAQLEAKEALEKYNQQLAGARDEASRIREEAKAQGAAIVAEMREKAQAEAERISQQTHAQIEADRKAAFESLRSDIGGLATTLAGKIVGESLADDERASRTIDRFLTELEQTEKVDQR